jgi:sugar lactone lactonase YvrE
LKILIFIGIIGNSTNQLNFPRGITFNYQSGIYYISDRDNHRILSYSPNTFSVNLIAGGNGAGKNYTQLNSPTGLDFDYTTNSLVIVNFGSNNLVRWVIGASNWTLFAGNINGNAGSTSSTFSGPYDVKVDAVGNAYVADTSNHRIQLFLAGQTNGSTIVGVTGVYGNTSNLLYNPASVAFDSRLNLYVSDTSNHRIQKFMHL